MKRTRWTKSDVVMIIVWGLFVAFLIWLAIQ